MEPETWEHECCDGKISCVGHLFDRVQGGPWVIVARACLSGLAALLLTGVSIMLSYQDRIPDKTIERKVTQRLGRAGLGEALPDPLPPEPGSFRQPGPVGRAEPRSALGRVN